MTSLRLYTTAENETLVDVRRPSLILSPTTPLFPLALISRPTRFIKHEVPLLNSYIPRTSGIMAHVKLGRADGWRSITGGHERELSIADASLHGEIQPRGLTKVAYSFPLMTSVVSSATFFVVSSLVLMTYLLIAVWWESPPSVEPYGRHGRPLVAAKDDTGKQRADLPNVAVHSTVKTEPDEPLSPEIGVSPILMRRRSTRFEDER